MAANISDRIVVSVSVASRGVAAQSVDLPLLLGYHTVFPEYTRTYRTPSAMIADGFSAYDPLVLMANALCSQQPQSVERFKVGRRATAFTHEVNLTIIADTGTISVTVTKGGVSRTYTQTGGGGGIPAEATALALAMNNDADGWGSSGDASAVITAATNDVNIVANTGHDGELWFYDDFSQITIDDDTADPGLAADLTALRAEDDDWYAVTLDSCSGAEGEGLEVALAAAEKLVLVGSQDSDVPTSATDDVASEFLADNNSRAGVEYSPHSMAEYPACAVLGKCLAYPVGSASWDMKSLVGVTAADLSATQMGYLDDKACNYYVSYVRDGGIHQHGTVASSDVGYLEIRQLLDYLVFRIRETVFNILLNSPKLPYTDATCIQIKGAILQVLKAVERNGGVMLTDEDGNSVFNFSYTPVSEQLEADQLDGILRGIEWSCPLIRGIRKVYITGQLVGV